MIDPAAPHGRKARNQLRRAGALVTLGYSESGHQPPPGVAVPGHRVWECRAGQGFLRVPQACDTVADPHRNPTDETAHSGTLVMPVKGTENSRSAAYMRVSWATKAFSR